MSDTVTSGWMRTFHDFLDSLDSDGGKICILLLLMGIGMIGTRVGIPKAEEITAGAFGALLMTMKDSGSNKDRREGAPMPLPTVAGAAPAALAAPAVPTSIVEPIVEAVENVGNVVREVAKQQ